MNLQVQLGFKFTSSSVFKISDLIENFLFKSLAANCR